MRTKKCSCWYEAIVGSVTFLVVGMAIGARLSMPQPTLRMNMSPMGRTVSYDTRCRAPQIGEELIVRVRRVGPETQTDCAIRTAGTMVLR